MGSIKSHFIFGRRKESWFVLKKEDCLHKVQGDSGMIFPTLIGSECYFKASWDYKEPNELLCHIWLLQFNNNEAKVRYMIPQSFLNTFNLRPQIIVLSLS